MRRLVASDRFPKAVPEKSQFDDFADEAEEKDLYDQLTSNKYDDLDFGENEEDNFNSDSLYDMDSDTIVPDEEDDNVDYVKVNKGMDSLLNVLRDELKLKECDRGYLTFKYRGEIYDGIPMVEINPSKFVFKIDDKMKSVLLSEITVM